MRHFNIDNKGSCFPTRESSCFPTRESSCFPTRESSCFPTYAFVLSSVYVAECLESFHFKCLYLSLCLSCHGPALAYVDENGWLPDFFINKKHINWRLILNFNLNFIAPRVHITTNRMTCMTSVFHTHRSVMDTPDTIRLSNHQPRF